MRIWLTTLGYSLILTAMFERTWQIKRVHGKVVKGNKLTTHVTGFLEVGGGMAIILAVQLIIMIVWTVTDPYNSDLDLTGDFTFEGLHDCASQHGNTWLTIEATYFGVLLVTFKNRIIILISRYGRFMSYTRLGR